MDTKCSKHAVFNINYHIVFCPKRRKKVLVEQINEDCAKIFKKICEDNFIKIESLSIMPDHIHLFVSCSPKLSPYKIVKLLKGSSSNYLRKTYPQLLKIPSLWSSSYYVGTVGHVSESIVKTYIENQKGK